MLVVSNVPFVTVNTPPMPSTASAPSCSFVPVRVTLNRLAVPERVDEPANVAVPLVAVKLPATERLELIEKLLPVEMLPGTFSALKTIVPAPLMVFAVPLRVIVPAVADHPPVTFRLPATVSELAVAIEPEMFR